TVVTMILPLEHEGQLPRVREEPAVVPARPDVAISASDARLLPGVLSRAVSAFALRRDASVDQIADAMLLAESVSSLCAPAFAGDELRFSLVEAEGEGGIVMTVGPLDDGGGDRLREGLRLPGDGGSVEALADRVLVDRRPEG